MLEAALIKLLELKGQILDKQSLSVPVL